MPLRAVLCWAQTAEGYRAMLSEEWLPRVGAAICAAHYLEHQLRWAGQVGRRPSDSQHSSAGSPCSPCSPCSR